MIQEDNQAEEPRDRWFNPYRQPRSQKAVTLAADAINAVLAHEERHNKRWRKRRKRDQASFEAAVSTIVCDVAYNYLADADRRVAINRSKEALCRKSRYRPRVYGKSIPYILDALRSADIGLIDQRLGQWKGDEGGKITTIHATPRLIQRLLGDSFEFSDFQQGKGEETIILRSAKEDQWDAKKLLEYTDTDTTRRFREEMGCINDWLARAEIWFDEAEEEAGKTVDVGRRRLRRIFTNRRFDNGGRLFGGFWQEIKKGQRRRGLWIDGEPAVELDYGQAAPRLLYGLEGVTPPSDDPYAISGIHPIFRDGVKKLFNALLFATSPLTKKPQGTAQLLPHWPVQQLTSALAEAHPAIAHHFHTGIGHHLQFRESQVLVRLLLSLQGEGITALPIHDAVLVAESNAERVQGLMKQVFRDAVGVEASVSVTPPP